MRKNNFISALVSILLLMVYVLSLAGLDVHTCSHSNETYVVFLSRSLTCDEIHPEHGHCPHCNCCHQHFNEIESVDSAAEGVLAFVPSACCNDDSHLILLTANKSGDSGVQVHKFLQQTALFPQFSLSSSKICLHCLERGMVSLQQCQYAEDIYLHNSILRC